MKRLVTLYIPTLNSEKTLPKCLGSLRKLSVFIIDGGSLDATVEIAKKNKISIIKPKKKGLANARNLAFKKCKTELIAFIDSDCVLDKNWLKNSILYFKDKKVAGVCGKLIEKNQETLADKWRSFHLRQDWGNTKVINPNFLFGSNSIFRLDALRKIGGYDEKYKTNYEDVDISRRLKEAGYKIIYEPKAVCYHLKKDTIRSVIKTSRNWSFYSYPVPDKLSNLAIRITIYNHHLFMKFIIKEILQFKFNLIILNVVSYFYNQYLDLKYFVKH